MRKVRVESAGSYSRHDDHVEVILDTRMGAVVRVTVTEEGVEWEFFESGTSNTTYHAMPHEVAFKDGFKL